MPGGLIKERFAICDKLVGSSTTSCMLYVYNVYKCITITS